MLVPADREQIPDPDECPGEQEKNQPRDDERGQQPGQTALGKRIGQMKPSCGVPLIGSLPRLRQGKHDAHNSAPNSFTLPARRSVTGVTGGRTSNNGYTECLPEFA